MAASSTSTRQHAAHGFNKPFRRPKVLHIVQHENAGEAMAGLVKANQCRKGKAKLIGAPLCVYTASIGLWKH